MKLERFDYTFFFIVLALTVVGFTIFSSAALGLLGRNGAPFSSVASGQVIFGIVGGSIALLVLSRLNYKLLAKFAIPFFVFALLLTWLTFVPHIGMEFKGANRWLNLGGFSFQPAELLKFASIALLASYYAANFKKIDTIKFGLMPFVIIVGLASLPMALQPDNDGIMVLVLACGAVFFAAGGRIKHFLVLFIAAALFASVAYATTPYVRDRVQTFLDPSRDPQGAGYQVKQSLIAIGSGQIFGRGFGQSIQKFSHLPEPVGDSVFAVAGEEFGFAGATLLVLLFLAFAAAGLRIAVRAGDRFGGLIVLGVVIIITVQSYVNIASLLGLFPLSGLPLIFVSQGGTALLVALAECGIVLSVSRKMKAV